jgi:hypothetical protein
MSRIAMLVSVADVALLRFEPNVPHMVPVGEEDV